MMDNRKFWRWWWVATGLLVLLMGLDARAADWSKQWEAMCRITEYSCEGITAPTVRVINSVRGEAGGYAGGDVIKVMKATRYYMKETAVHEMVHYLLTELGVYVIPTTSVDVFCASEAAAWEVSNKYRKRVQGRKLQYPKWWKLYPLCEEPT